MITNFLKGKCCLLICSKRGHDFVIRDNQLASLVNLESVYVAIFDGFNSNLDDIESFIKKIPNKKFDVIIGFGGGKIMDVSKITAKLISNIEIKEKISYWIQNRNLLWVQKAQRKVSLILVPTTIGTGSEVTPFAVLWDNKNKKKLSVCDDDVWADIAFIDPEMAADLSYEDMLPNCLDAYNQAVESLWNRNCNDITYSYAINALRLFFSNLDNLVTKRIDQIFRAEMAKAGLFSGLAISETKTSICHSISYPLTSHYGIPHGLACAFTMPAVLLKSIHRDPLFFEKVAKDLFGVRDLEVLTNEFFGAHSRLAIRDRVVSLVGDDGLTSMLALKDQMWTAERATNSFVQEEDIVQILSESWRFAAV